MKYGNLFMVILAFSFLVVGCTQVSDAETVPAADNSSAVADNSSAVAPVANSAPDAGVDEAAEVADVIEINLTANNWAFEPSTIQAKKGQLVKLHVTSVDVAHGFALPVFGINERLEPGEVVDIEFTPNQVGTFTFFCNVYCGDGHSEMRGELVVTE